MHLFYSIHYFIIFLLKYDILCQDSPTKCMIKLDLEVCYSVDPVNVTDVGCHKANVCQKQFNVTYVDLKPYSYDILADLLRTCCGACIKVSKVNTLNNMYQVPPSITGTSHFVFPVLGRHDVLTLYGYRFIPLIETPKIYYITKKPDDMMPQLVISCMKMWPLVVICLFMVVISGFIVWLFETWVNPAEFPRPFLVGVFEGAWWSIISMTTVGYGDKTPISVPARVISMLWIFLGITIFSLVHAMLSSEVNEATLRSSTIAGSKVGTLRHGIYEENLVSKYGGNLIEVETKDGTNGVHELISKLQKKEIDGFVLDRYILLSYKRECENVHAHHDDIAFLNTKTIRRELLHRGAYFSYGILVKNLDDYNFLVDFVTDNRVVINTCNTLLLNNYSRVTKAPTETYPLFLHLVKVSRHLLLL